MHAMQARVGGLLVVTGFTLAFTLGAAWAAVGAAMLVGRRAAARDGRLTSGQRTKSPDVSPTADRGASG
jgi:hypothetical protein